MILRELMGDVLKMGCYRFKYLSQISVELTNKCNFSCLHCINESGCASDSFLEKSKVLEIIKYI